MADQINYLAQHGITNDGRRQLHHHAGATDFNYFVQIGNKGTWSEAAVDVKAPPPPVDTHHAGDQIAKWDFEDNAVTDARGYQQ